MVEWHLYSAMFAFARPEAANCKEQFRIVI